MTKQKIAGEDASVFLYVADITDVTQVELAVIAANEFHQQTTDHVVCAASASVLGDVLNQDLLNLKRNMDVNYFGTLNVLKVPRGGPRLACTLIHVLIASWSVWS